MLIDRDVAATLGQETVAILDAGGYTSPSGRHVSLRAALEATRSATAEYPPERNPPLPTNQAGTTAITVENATVLVVGRRLRPVERSQR